ncbi:MAG: hypothetical protein ACRD2O_06375 [Terriglobia bacterium]
MGSGLLCGIGPSQVEVELVEGSLGQEVSATGKGFQIKELVFDEAMDGLDIGLVSVGGGRDAFMLRAEVGDGGGEGGAGAVGLQFTNELAATVGLPGEVAEDDAAAL